MNVVDTSFANEDGLDPMDTLYVLKTVPSKRNNEDQSQSGRIHSMEHRSEYQTFTRFSLQNTFLLMGLKSDDIKVIVYWIFEKAKKQVWEGNGALLPENITPQTEDGTESSETQPSSPLKVAIKWSMLTKFVSMYLTHLEYSKPQHLLELKTATEFVLRKRSFIILLCGTSGTGKSTLGSLLSARLGLKTVLPTDSIRHLLRTFVSKEDHPALFASTYQAGDCCKYEDPDHPLSEKKRILKGYKLQSDLVLEKLDHILTMFERTNESIVVEGVHLQTDKVLSLMKKHPTCIPFLVYISNETKHRERFAVRARHMTIDPSLNKYIKHFKNIRIIQKSLYKNATKFLIPTIDNTNVDRSVATIHSTLIRVLKRLANDESLVDKHVGKLVPLSREHERTMKRAWSSKAMRKAMEPFLRQKVSKRLLLRRLVQDQQRNHKKNERVRQGRRASQETSADAGGGNGSGSGSGGLNDSFNSMDEDSSSSEGSDTNADTHDDEQVTVDGSLMSGYDNNENDFAIKARLRPSFIQSEDGGGFGLDESVLSDSTMSRAMLKRQRSFANAITQAARWRAGQVPTTGHLQQLINLSANSSSDRAIALNSLTWTAPSSTDKTLKKRHSDMSTDSRLDLKKAWTNYDRLRSSIPSHSNTIPKKPSSVTRSRSANTTVVSDTGQFADDEGGEEDQQYDGSESEGGENVERKEGAGMTPRAATPHKVRRKRKSNKSNSQRSIHTESSAPEDLNERKPNYSPICRSSSAGVLSSDDVSETDDWEGHLDHVQSISDIENDRRSDASSCVVTSSECGSPTHTNPRSYRLGNPSEILSDDAAIDDVGSWRLEGLELDKDMVNDEKVEHHQEKEKEEMKGV